MFLYKNTHTHLCCSNTHTHIHTANNSSSTQWERMMGNVAVTQSLEALMMCFQ